MIRSFEMGEYVNLRTLSDHSFGKSVLKIEDIIEAANKNNAFSVGICDRMNMFGSAEFSSKAIKKKIKPILGVLLKVEEIGYLPAFIQNEEGYKYICEILTFSQLKEEKTISLSDLEKNKGIILLTGDEESIFNQEEENDKKDYFLSLLKKWFPSRLYIEIYDGTNFTNYLLDRAKNYSLPIVITAKSSCKEDREDNLKALYVNNLIHDNKIYDSDEFESLKKIKRHFRSSEEMYSKYSHLKEGLENTVRIAERCSFYIKGHSPIVPKYTDPDYPEGTKEEDILRDKAYKGLRDILKNIPPEKHDIYYKRLEYELEVLIEKKFAGYFLVTYEFVNYAHKIGVPVGLGRGSGAGSLTALCLGITQLVDPIKYGLIFERFINPQRPSMPDFDIDFAPEGIEPTINHLKEKKGEFNVANILTIGTFKARGAFACTAKALGISYKEAEEICKLFPEDQIRPVSLFTALQIVPNLKILYSNDRYREIFDIALHIEGISRHISKHAAGIVIGDKPLYEYAPLILDEDKKLVIALTMKWVEYIGLIKFDLLGLVNLSIIKNTLSKIKEERSIDLKIEDIPIHDKKAFDLICKLNLEGIFQFESSGMKEIINELQPDSLEDLIAINALFRPGPIKSIPTYIRRKNKVEEVSYLHPSLEGILKSTYGVMVYQEQVMDIARICGGYSLAEADILRRAMGKKQPEEMAKQRERFMSGCLKNGISEDIANTLFEQMSEFSGYGFNKSHASPYAYTGYICAYLKANYPLEFMSSIMTLEMKDDTKLVSYMYNLHEMNIKILPPSVNYSLKEFAIEKDAIRFALGAIKNVGESLAENICKERENKDYEDLHDFIMRNHSHMNKRQLKYLIYSGALDDFLYKREDLIESLDDLNKGLTDIFPSGKQWSMIEKLNYEKEAFGFYLEHPMKRYRSIVRELGCITLEEAKKSSKNNIIVGGLIVNVKRKRGANKSTYAFVTLSDESSLGEITIFGKVLLEKADLIKEGHMVIMDINIKIMNDMPRFTGRNVYSIDELLNKNFELYIDNVNKDEISKVEEILSRYNGNNRVYMNLGAHQIISLNRVSLKLDLIEELNKGNMSVKIRKFNSDNRGPFIIQG